MRRLGGRAGAGAVELVGFQCGRRFDLLLGHDSILARENAGAGGDAHGWDVFARAGGGNSDR